MLKLPLRPIRRAVIGFAAASMLVGLAAPANAATSASVRPATLPTATIYRTIYLAAVAPIYTAPAQVPAGTPGDRYIYLATGDYRFGQVLVGPNNETIRDSRTIFLLAGTYEWHCSIGGTGESSPWNYMTWCSLTPYSFIGDQAQTPGVTALMTSGDWDWTGYLTPLFG